MIFLEFRFLAVRLRVTAEHIMAQQGVPLEALNTAIIRSI